MERYSEEEIKVILSELCFSKTEIIERITKLKDECKGFDKEKRLEQVLSFLEKVELIDLVSKPLNDGYCSYLFNEDEYSVSIGFSNDFHFEYDEINHELFVREYTTTDEQELVKVTF